MAPASIHARESQMEIQYFQQLDLAASLPKHNSSHRRRRGEAAWNVY